MRVVDLQIANFRGIKRGRIRFGEHSVFVGPNNCGKTTIIEALALLFGRDRMVRSLTEHDFFGGDPQPADRIRLVATVIGFAGDDPSEHPDWFRDDRAIPAWWNAAAGEVSPTRDDAAWPLACRIGFCARFDRAELEVETLRYFHDDDAIGDVFVDENVVPVPGRLIRDLGFFFVPASRTWDRVISFGSELFRRVIASAGGQPAESVLAERDRLRAPEQPLEQDVRLAPIVARINAELSSFFRPAPSLHLRVTPTDSDGLLEAVVPHYKRAEAEHGLPARRHGSGLVSLQHLLLLLQFGRQRAQLGETFWMALEEPELHVPPPLQRRLVHRIQALSAQTFVSTHSPTVAAISNPQSVLVLRNEAGELSSTPLLAASLPAETSNAVRKLFQIHRANTIAALMHDAVLIPEGRIDQEFLSLLVRAVEQRQGWAADEECRFGAHIGLIPTHDAAVEATVQALTPLHPRLTALVDGDDTGISYAHSLAATAAPAITILRWPDNWTTEDALGWILEANIPDALRELNQNLSPEATSAANLVARLKSSDRAVNGLKQDQIAYEAIVDAIGTIDACRTRATEVLNAICDATLGIPTSRFSGAADASRILIFQP